MNLQPSLFDDICFTLPPPTEGVKYAGSKLKLIPHILDLAQRVNARRVLDGFSGTTRVSQALAKSGYDVICNDRAVWSETFGCCYLLSHKKELLPISDQPSQCSSTSIIMVHWALWWRCGRAAFWPSCKTPVAET